MHFLKQWWHVSTWVIPYLYHGLKGMDNTATKSLILSILTACGLTGAAIYWNWFIPIPWWGLLALSVFMSYLGVTAGLAWEQSRGVDFEVELPEYDPSTKTFRLLLINGEFQAKVELQINNIRKSDGRRLLTGPLFRVPLTSNPNVDFRSREERYYSICKLSKSSGHPCLTVDNPNGPEPISASDDVALPKQTPIRFHLIITADATLSYGKPPTRKTESVYFTFTPDSSLESCYRVALEHVA